MSERISKDHSRRVMEMLEDLTGGLITKEDILFKYEMYRRINFSRTNALWEAFRIIIFTRYTNTASYLNPVFLGLKDYNGETLKIMRRSTNENVYRKVAISYPDATPAQFTLEVYEVKPEFGDSYYYYLLFIKEEDNIERVRYDSELDNKIYKSLSETVDDGLETLVESMVVYALDKTAHKEEPDVLFKAWE